ncbi:hypothetical protein IE81DRAFT_327165 [Ceraceosorus guamensis]|uniref:Uncharacterized protein n=1 Tax=Ceraceosorus guamensis TaxID=1522189 RepID=A0A316VTB0_9BASI|nr:hypothetical protein IE81DRAFT_327165 [Ceraceosorus guamensis]PWN38755.1 hypothetical protein IE81DRAFT_327165 [Ceraceosorus guamensis]
MGRLRYLQRRSESSDNKQSTGTGCQEAHGGHAEARRAHGDGSIAGSAAGGSRRCTAGREDRVGLRDDGSSGRRTDGGGKLGRLRVDHRRHESRVGRVDALDLRKDAGILGRELGNVREAFENRGVDTAHCRDADGAEVSETAGQTGQVDAACQRSLASLELCLAMAKGEESGRQAGKRKCSSARASLNASASFCVSEGVRCPHLPPWLCRPYSLSSSSLQPDRRPLHKSTETPPPSSFSP